jgi:hypothetical protein
MKKSNHRKLCTLELRKQIIAHLDAERLKEVVGGNNSTRPSQCPTLCF